MLHTHISFTPTHPIPQRCSAVVKQTLTRRNKSAYSTLARPFPSSTIRGMFAQDRRIQVVELLSLHLIREIILGGALPLFRQHTFYGGVWGQAQFY